MLEMFKALILLIQSLYRKNKWKKNKKKKKHFYKKESKGNDFWGMLISADIILGMADIPDIFSGMADIPGIIFLVNTSCWGPAYVSDKIQSTHPHPHPRGR